MRQNNLYLRWALVLAVVLQPALVSAEQFLRQSTAQTAMLGPFLDSVDGSTAETALTISQADIRLSKAGGAFAQSNNSAGATHGENGYYSVPLDATDTNTVGRLRVAISESGALPVWQDFMVLSENAWRLQTYGKLPDVWHVATTGNDSTGNGSREAPFLTIGAAETAASAGDTIRIAAGSYTSYATVTKTGLTFEGVDTDAVILSNAAGLTVADNTTLRRMTLTTTGVNPGVICSGMDCVWIDQCIINGDIDGILAASSQYLKVTRSTVKGKWDGCNLTSARGSHWEDVYLWTDGTNSTDTVRAINAGSTPNGLEDQSDFHRFINCQIAARIASGSTGGGQKVHVIAGSGNYLLENCSVVALVEDTDFQDDVTCITEQNGAGLANQMHLTMIGGYVYTEKASGTGAAAKDVDLKQAASRCRLSNVKYDAAKVFGDVKDGLHATTPGRTLDVSTGGEAGLDWANVGSPTTPQTLSGTTVATVTTLTGHTPQTGDAFARLGAPAGASVSADLATIAADTNEVQGDWVDGGRLDLLLDAKATSAQVAAVSVAAVSPDRVSKQRTWIGREYRASNIVEVGATFDGTLSLIPDLNPNASIDTVDSVSITGAAVVTATGLSTTADRMRANFTVPTLTTVGTYTVVVTVTTTDGDTIPTTATLIVR